MTRSRCYTFVGDVGGGVSECVVCCAVVVVLRCLRRKKQTSPILIFQERSREATLSVVRKVGNHKLLCSHCSGSFLRSVPPHNS